MPCARHQSSAKAIARAPNPCPRQRSSKYKLVQQAEPSAELQAEARGDNKISGGLAFYLHQPRAAVAGMGKQPFGGPARARPVVRTACAGVQTVHQFERCLQRRRRHRYKFKLHLSGLYNKKNAQKNAAPAVAGAAAGIFPLFFWIDRGGHDRAG